MPSLFYRGDEMSNFDFASDSVIDVRDIIERFEELENGPLTEQECATLAVDTATTLGELTEEQHKALYLLAESDRDEYVEFRDLKEVLEELCGNGGDEQWRGDWYPITLIRETYFEEYAQELAEECGMVASDSKWPNNHIGWGAAARDLEQDYSTLSHHMVGWFYR